jgi:glycosyltransferase involved in cell wall biosynthesis
MSDNTSIELTVIVITTNRSNTIKETLQSILDNAKPSISIRLYDFKSTDLTVEIVRSFLKENELNWDFFCFEFRLDDCKDWQYCLNEVEGGYITFLEGDDRWPDGFIDKLHEITKNNPTVGLMHFSAFNERGEKQKKIGNKFYTGKAYRREYLGANINGCYAPSQTVFKISSDSIGIKFEFERYPYAPEPKMWLNLSQFYDVYICSSVSIYRGISQNSTLKRQALKDILTYAEDLIATKEVQKLKVILQIVYFLFFNYLAVHYKKIYLGIEKLEFHTSVQALIVTIKSIRRIISA